MNQHQRPQTRLHTLRNFAACSLAAALLLVLAPALRRADARALRRDPAQELRQSAQRSAAHGPLVVVWRGRGQARDPARAAADEGRRHSGRGARLRVSRGARRPGQGPQEPSLPLARDAGRRQLRAGGRPQAGSAHRRHALLRLALRRPAHHARRGLHRPPHRRGSCPAGAHHRRPRSSRQAVDTPQRIPRRRHGSEGDSVISAVIADPRNCRSRPQPAAGRGGRGGGPRPPSFDAATAKPITVTGTSATFAPSDKPRVAVFFVQSHTRQQVKRAAVGAEGYVLDSFSHEAVAKHIEKVGEPLIKAFGDDPALRHLLRLAGGLRRPTGPRSCPRSSRSAAATT